LTVTIYSKPNCPHCNIVKTQFKKHGVPYTEIDILQDADALKLIKSHGFTAAPVVTDGVDSFSGADAKGIDRFREKHGA
jgi:glutaredoxin-like protein NrdH